MKKSEKSPLGYYTIGIAALFLAGFLLLVVLGARSFRNTVTVQSGNMDNRAILSYIATSVRANDTAGAVSVRDDGGGQILSLADGDTGYALRIFCRDGRLMEEYARQDAEIDPEDAEIIGETKTFEIEMLDGGLYSVTTDEGRVLFRMRSEGGAGP